MAQVFYFGPYSDGIYGFKTALPGYDVMDEADDNNFERRSFNSRSTANLAKIAAIIRGTGSTIVHALGYVPHIEAKVYTPGNPAIFNNDKYNGVQNYIWPSIDTSSITYIGHAYPAGAAYTGDSLVLCWDNPR